MLLFHVLPSSGDSQLTVVPQQAGAPLCAHYGLCMCFLHLLPLTRANTEHAQAYPLTVFFLASSMASQCWPLIMTPLKCTNAQDRDSQVLGFCSFVHAPRKCLMSVVGDSEKQLGTKKS